MEPEVSMSNSLSQREGSLEGGPTEEAVENVLQFVRVIAALAAQHPDAIHGDSIAPPRYGVVESIKPGVGN